MRICRLHATQYVFRLGDHVAYGTVSSDGETYALANAPTQIDFDSVATALDGMTAEQIVDAMVPA
jgi:hypothetical protein